MLRDLDGFAKTCGATAQHQHSYTPAELPFSPTDAPARSFRGGPQCGRHSLHQSAAASRRAAPPHYTAGRVSHSPRPRPRATVLQCGTEAGLGVNPAGRRSDRPGPVNRPRRRRGPRWRLVRVRRRVRQSEERRGERRRISASPRVARPVREREMEREGGGRGEREGGRGRERGLRPPDPSRGGIGWADAGVYSTGSLPVG